MAPKSGGDRQNSLEQLMNRMKLERTLTGVPSWLHELKHCALPPTGSLVLDSLLRIWITRCLDETSHGVKSRTYATRRSAPPVWPETPTSKKS